MASRTAYQSPMPNKAPTHTTQFVIQVVKLFRSVCWIFKQQFVTSFYMNTQKNPCVRCSFTPMWDSVVSLQSKSLFLAVVWNLCSAAEREIEFQHPLDAVASERGPAEQGTAEHQSARLCKDGLGCILQNLLIKAVVKSFWHLGFFFAPSKVSWSSAADSNEKRIRH